MFLPGLPSKSSSRQKVLATVYGKWHPKKSGLWGCKETGSLFIAIGELHVGLAWDIRVIPLREQIDPDIS
jgi:hypothetical protein